MQNYCINFFLLLNIIIQLKGVFMKPKWNDNEIKELFKIIENNESLNKPIMHSFREYAKISNRNALSVRNFYYAFLKILKNNKDLQKKLDINISKHVVQNFIHFKTDEENLLKNQLLTLTNNGLSTRSACLQLSGGDIHAAF